MDNTDDEDRKQDRPHMNKPQHVSDVILTDLIERSGKIVERRNLSGRIMVSAAHLYRITNELKRRREWDKITDGAQQMIDKAKGSAAR